MANATALTVHDLAADSAWMEESGRMGFMVDGSPQVWEEADYPEHRADMTKVRISQVRATMQGVRAIVRYIDPMTSVRCFVERPDFRRKGG
jgi:hypothetical protein